MAATSEPQATTSHILVNGSTIKVAVATEPESDTRPAIFPSFGEYPVYDERVYRIMSGDVIRNDAFTAVLRDAVPGKRVLDIGTGADLKWAKEALELGAATVVGVEAMSESFDAAQRIRSDLGIGERLEVIHGLSTTMRLADRADVCVAEIIGSLAGAEGAAAVIADARRRLLSASCTVVPHRAATRVAAVRLRDILADHPVAFSRAALPYIQKIFRWNGRPFDVRLRIAHPDRTQPLLSGSAEVEVLELNGDLRTSQQRTVRLEIGREGAVDGLLAWMQLWCDPESSPIDTLRDETNWGAIYFPLFDRSVQCRPGDSLTVDFRVRLAVDRVHPIYDIGGSLTRDGRMIASGLHTSNFGGTRFREQALHRTLFPL